MGGSMCYMCALFLLYKYGQSVAVIFVHMLYREILHQCYTCVLVILDKLGKNLGCVVDKCCKRTSHFLKC
jgi:hypothetical protein